MVLSGLISQDPAVFWLNVLWRWSRATLGSFRREKDFAVECLLSLLSSERGVFYFRKEESKMKQKHLKLSVVFLTLTLTLLIGMQLSAALAASPDWTSFRGAASNNAVAQVETPKTAEEAELLFKISLKDPSDWQTNVSDPVRLGETVYLAVGDELRAFDAKTGAVIATGALSAPIGYICRLYAQDGKIFVPLGDGRVEALSCEMLSSIWVSEALPPITTASGTFSHQLSSTLTGSDGRIYAATACADYSNSYAGTILCLDAETGEAIWKWENDAAGYYWSGAVLSEQTMYLAGDDGILLALDTSSGQERARIDLGDRVRASLVLDGNFLYATTYNGTFHRIALVDGGTFGAVQSVNFAAGSTSTPAVFGGKAYVGGNTADYTGLLAVIDLATMSVERTYDAPAAVQASPFVAVGEDGAVAVYYTSNTTPGALYVLTDGNAEVLFTPSAQEQNYCMASVSAGADGTLFYTNDSGTLFAISRKQQTDPIPGSEPESSVPSEQESSGSDAASTGPAEGTTSENSAPPALGESFPLGAFFALLVSAVTLAAFAVLLKQKSK